MNKKNINRKKNLKEKCKFENFDTNIDILINCIELFNCSLSLGDNFTYSALLVFKAAINSFLDDYKG